MGSGEQDVPDKLLVGCQRDGLGIFLVGYAAGGECVCSLRNIFEGVGTVEASDRGLMECCELYGDTDHCLAGNGVDDFSPDGGCEGGG